MLIFQIKKYIYTDFQIFKKVDIEKKKNNLQFKKPEC